MGFRLGSESREKNNLNRNIFNKDEVSIPGVEVIRKDLEPGIDGEANNDGTIFISNLIEPGSEEERKILMHEMKHMVDMRIGRLDYDDNHVLWDGNKYMRDNILGMGYVKFEDNWYPEGDTNLPWEKE